MPVAAHTSSVAQVIVASSFRVTVRLAVTPFITIVPKSSAPVAVSVSGLMMRAEADGGAPVTPTGAAIAGVAASAMAASAAAFTNLVMAIFPTGSKKRTGCPGNPSIRDAAINLDRLRLCSTTWLKAR